MAVIILVRELLVTSIRATLESARIEFSAMGAGKLKMILQAVAVPLLLAVAWGATEAHWVLWVRDVTVWTVVVVTILSGLPYITGAMKAANAAHGPKG
ncbi:MAG: hypothetical protein GVY28_08485 [Alphaproteobacteria bacterium]|nr:hypothetical protein [Alphaproteobacteria bacterium]